MATLSTYLKLALTFLLAIPVKDILDAVVGPFLTVGCSGDYPTVVAGAQNCTYVQQALTWFLGLVLVGMFVTALSKGVIHGGIRQ
jgi:hypothetical protein